MGTVSLRKNGLVFYFQYINIYIYIMSSGLLAPKKAKLVEAEQDENDKYKVIRHLSFSLVDKDDILSCCRKSVFN